MLSAPAVTYPSVDLNKGARFRKRMHTDRMASEIGGRTFVERV